MVKMKPFLLPALVCLLGSSMPARAAVLVADGPYVNLSETFEWGGLWTTVEDQAAASEVLTHDPGRWNMTLTAKKTVEGGKESYFMKFDGAHNTGPTELFQPTALNSTFSPMVHDDSLTHVVRRMSGRSTLLRSPVIPMWCAGR